jgi:hypothetical protein
MVQPLHCSGLRSACSACALFDLIASYYNLCNKLVDEAIRRNELKFAHICIRMAFCVITSKGTPYGTPCMRAVQRWTLIYLARNIGV